ncbi:pyridoxamine 5'-phosphate oxidase [Streptomyces tateyamensis]|uniref:Pyridoxamine 5'-phosphate oxidase n=1 Tax=Streptomyces tateyamensis TaxID=565073 RepID=A0A2V4NCA0_9ACTN|nr:pyridoxamine 5'-phosphate oxidase family protein [Streptomyces tateyamensis]PYC76750.1 pyridoxamine 5'-phosphate oxidase [Streptomyces tateyamensis]
MDQVDRIEELDEAACLRLLSTVPIGRVVYTEHALLRVVPVAFQVEPGGRLVLALLPGSPVLRVLDGMVCAFQADRLDEHSRTGWSVVVHGTAAVVRDPAAHAELLRSGPRSWVTEREPVFVRLTSELFTGRRLHPPAVRDPLPHGQVTGE